MVVDFGAGPLSARAFAESTKTPQYILGGLAYDKQYPMTRSWWPEIPWEGAVDGQFIAKNVPNPKVATIAVNNEVAPALVAGVKSGLGDKKSAFVKDVRYEATQVDLSAQVNKLRASGVNALVCLVTGATEVQLLKYIHQIGWHPKLFLYSGTVSRKSIFEPAGLANAKDVYAAMWLKDPSDPKWAKDTNLAEYRADIAKYGKGADAADIVAANGYAAAQAVVKALGTMEDPTQEGFIKALDAFPATPLPLLQPGITLKPGPDAHLVSQYQMVQFDGDGFTTVGSPVQVAGS
jgi:branched-chain amino acid transport system substrate-binding protein